MASMLIALMLVLTKVRAAFDAKTLTTRKTVDCIQEFSELTLATSSGSEEGGGCSRVEKRACSTNQRENSR